MVDPSPPRGERADAARNRERVLAAAQGLLRDDPRGTTLEDIAREAGVGKATLYRRYPDKAAIAVALLDEHERELQERLLSGPPPLGPSETASPADRLSAFYRAYLDFLEANGHLSIAIEDTGQRLSTGAHGSWRTHVAALLEAAGVAGDPALLAEQLLAPLAPDLVAHERRSGRSVAELAGALDVLARRVVSDKEFRTRR